MGVSRKTTTPDRKELIAMKTIVSLLLFAAIAFLCLTNPTADEYISWYVSASLDDVPDAEFDRMGDRFCSHMRSQVRRSDYLLCSIYTYRGRDTLALGLLFFPLDSMAGQMQMLRTDYDLWLEHSLS